MLHVIAATEQSTNSIYERRPAKATNAPSGGFTVKFCGTTKPYVPKPYVWENLNFVRLRISYYVTSVSTRTWITGSINMLCIAFTTEADFSQERLAEYV
eukprot:2411339-Amphidinium_carterae.1